MTKQKRSILADSGPLAKGPSMSTPDFINDPGHWLDRAAEMRALAETMDDVDVRASASASTLTAGRWDKSNLPGSLAPLLSTAPTRPFQGLLCERLSHPQPINNLQLFVDGTATTPFRRT
jgi:hypothetical protein